MVWTARDVMQSEVRTVAPDMALPDLERAFLRERVTGFPVVERDGRLIGIVSRSDVVRQLSVEQSVGEQMSDYYRQDSVPSEAALPAIAEHVGRRMEGLRVRDVMVERLVTSGPDEPLEDVARRLLKERIHRMPVVDDGRLVGIVSSVEFVRLFAEGRVALD
jgi:CBS domain-containing protein